MSSSVAGLPERVVRALRELRREALPGGQLSYPLHTVENDGGVERTTAKVVEYDLDSGYDVLQDRVQWIDTLGAKAKLTLELPRVHWFVQGQLRGLVADGGPDPTITLTDWSMKESGRGKAASIQ